MSSYRNINYSIRPGKSTERKILVAMIRELCRKHSSEYNYIGFGSTYFTDFKLFHKELHIPKLITIEKDKHIEERIKFNRPFNCIEIIMEDSTTALQKIAKWDQKNIVWLDYDDVLEPYMFNDIDITFNRLIKDSIFLVTCNSLLRDNNNSTFNTKSFKNKFGTLAPITLTNKDFASKNSPKTIRNLFLSRIDDVLKTRNSVLTDDQKLIFRPLFFFTYSDNASMVTFGGVLDFKKNTFNLEDHPVSKFSTFVKTSDIPYNIKTPNITFKEYQLLNKYVPSGPKLYLKRKPIKFIPEREKKQFLELYKFLPNYMDVIS